MTTNRDWLFSLPLDEQIAWMNAEHVESHDSDTVSKIRQQVFEHFRAELERRDEREKQLRDMLSCAYGNAHDTLMMLDEGLA